MVVYFYSQAKNEVSRAILQYLRKAQVETFSNLNANKPGDASLAQADALVIYGKNLAEESSYFVALAISENKPVLFLTDQQGIKNKALKSLGDNKNFKNKVEIKACAIKNINQILLNFLQKLDQDSGRDIINVKYTLRVSPKMSDYLAWRAQTEGMPKADWLRSLIDQQLQKDKDYHIFLQKKYKA
ncbi:hypothetical protein H6761_02100 [Candidatus Nomurabacteria bacterium]|nr:hypothetical protein [Candidatus Nomurabacteria bacterium]